MINLHHAEELKCSCGSEHMHPARLLLLAPISDDNVAMFYNIDINDASIKEKYVEVTGNRNRESSFIIKYVCENCHEVICFEFYFHKGQVQFWSKFETDKNEKQRILKEQGMLPSL